jgi:hypothetical protein
MDRFHIFDHTGSGKHPSAGAFYPDS